MEETYEFVVDAMLGKLAKWLRVLGYSTFYNPKVSDDNLLRIAKNYNAILITRDKGLYNKAISLAIKVIFFENIDLVSMLKRLLSLKYIDAKIDFNKTRCPKCNSKLIIVDKNEIKDKVPKFVFEKYNIFLLCPNCYNIYWPGKHYKNMVKTLSRLKSSTE